MPADVNSSWAGARALARSSVIQGMAALGALQRVRSRVAQAKGIVVLTLHRIVPDAELEVCRSPAGMVLRESRFARLLEYLEERTRLVAPDEARVTLDTSYAEDGRDCDARPRVLLTFDDGWADNAEVAQPYLDRAGIRAVFFVVTGRCGRAQPFWPELVLGLLDLLQREGRLELFSAMLRSLVSERAGVPPPPANLYPSESVLSWLKQFSEEQILRAAARTQAESQVRTASQIKTAAQIRTAAQIQAQGAQGMPQTGSGRVLDPRERLMDWNQVCGLARAGHTIGSHTSDHTLLPGLEPDRMLEELMSSQRMLDKCLASTSKRGRWFSYPNGAHCSRATAACREAGFTHAFTTSPGLWSASADAMLVPRINVWDGMLVDSGGNFSQAHLDYALFWRALRASG